MIRENDHRVMKKHGRGLSIGLVVLFAVSALIHGCATTGKKESTEPAYEKIPFSDPKVTPFQSR